MVQPLGCRSEDRCCFLMSGRRSIGYIPLRRNAETERNPSAEVDIMRYRALLLLIVISGCRTSSEQVSDPDISYSPLLIIQFLEVETSPDLPWSVSSEYDNVSASMLHPDDGNETLDNSSIISEALQKGLLLALVNDSCRTYGIGSEHIQIWMDSIGMVNSYPGDLLPELQDTSWLVNADSQSILLELFDMYKPDIILMAFRIPEVSATLQMAEYWTTPDVLSRYRVIMFHLALEPDSRGWCVIAGDGINGSSPRGLTVSGMFSTIKLLSGLCWIDDLPENVPAFSVLDDTDESWRDQ